MKMINKKGHCRREREIFNLPPHCAQPFHYGDVFARPINHVARSVFLSSGGVTRENEIAIICRRGRGIGEGGHEPFFVPASRRRPMGHCSYPCHERESNKTNGTRTRPGLNSCAN